MGEGIKLPVINGLGRTDRIDNWWAQPFWMGLALTAALIYTAWRLILFPESISYKLEGSTVVSPIFSPNILEWSCLLYTSPSPRDLSTSRMPSSA